MNLPLHSPCKSEHSSSSLAPNLAHKRRLGSADRGAEFAFQICPACCELLRCQIVLRARWEQRVIIDSPDINHLACVIQNEELGLVEALPTELPVEAFDAPVRHQPAGNDAMLRNLVLLRPNRPIF
jgi:hypothetical protein